MKFEIKHLTGRVLFECEAATLALAVAAACSSGANLYGANLCGANLCGANLYGANLCGANLYGANLYGADLCGADLRGADLGGANLGGADLGGASLRGADLGGANLGGASLRGADLGGANLYGANLGGANLRGANLRGADLGGADLGGARGLTACATTSLAILPYQTGKIRALKIVGADGHGPSFRAPRPYVVGETYEDPKAITDPTEQCAAGINVASPDWIWKEFQAGQRILLVEFTAKDIAAIPIGSDGKFRLHRCKVVKELEPHTLGLPREECSAASVATDLMVALCR